MRVEYLKSFLIILLIAVWQLFFISRFELSDNYTRYDASGLMYVPAKSFTYFYFYKNLYPLRSTFEDKSYSVEGADDILENHKETLDTDNSFYITWGDHGKSLLLLIDSIFKGDPKNPSVIGVNSFLFIFALSAIYISFKKQGYELLGILLVLFLGSHPFQIFEIYKNENIFGWNIMIMLFLLSVNLGLFKADISTKTAYIISIISGVILGIVSHIRIESTGPALACVLIYLTLHVSKAIKIKLVLGLLLGAIFTSVLLSTYFNYKISQTYKLVKDLNVTSNQVFESRKNYHTIWHPIMIGFADYDTKYDFKWDDNMAYKYARPILQEKYPKQFPAALSGESMSATPEYNAVIRNKVLSTILMDPFWYLGILSRRVNSIFLDAVPLQIHFGNFVVTFYNASLLYLPLLTYLFIKREWFFIKILLFSLSASLPILIIHSSRNITNISCYHYFAVAIILYLLIKKYVRISKL